MWYDSERAPAQPNGDEIPSLEEPPAKEPKLLNSPLGFAVNIHSMPSIPSLESSTTRFHEGIGLTPSSQDGDIKNEIGTNNPFSVLSLTHSSSSFSLKTTPAFPFPPTQPLDPFSHIQSRKNASLLSPRSELELPLMPNPVILETQPATRTFKEFKLLNQPKEKQRKSYKKENRYLLPNPLTILYAGTSPEKLFGKVSVKLVSETGTELEDGKENMLDGILEKALDAEKKAQFSLKILGTSEGCKYCLQFNIRYYFLSNYPVAYQETILSNSFKVASNKKKIFLGKVSIN
jgi:hypothetical protein